MELGDISLVDISELGTGQRTSAARLVIQSLPPYYSVDGIDESEMVDAVAVLLGKPGSELESGFAGLYGNGLVGILTHIESGRLPLARLVGTQALMKALSPESVRLFREHLKNYDAGFGEVPDKSHYLCRIAIDRHHRGTGLAGKMMRMFLSIDSDGPDRKGVYSLHVDKGNTRAIAFYRKHGFVEVGCGLRYLTMVHIAAEAAPTI